MSSRRVGVAQSHASGVSSGRRMKMDHRPAPSRLLVQWPLPWVSSTSSVSPGPKRRVSPLLTRASTWPFRLAMICLRGALWQSLYSPLVQRRMTPCAGNTSVILPSGCARVNGKLTSLQKDCTPSSYKRTMFHASGGVPLSGSSIMVPRHLPTPTMQESEHSGRRKVRRHRLQSPWTIRAKNRRCSMALAGV